jgi:2,4-dienoyl-CoA reductase-like NADH-dependent reductase (Old Yellow Enzyme family)
MSKYSRLQEALKLPNGAVLKSPTAMAPMVVCGSNEDGTVSQKDIDYFDKRSGAAGIIITGAAAINEAGWAEKNQIGVFNDKHVEGLSTLAKTAQKDGNKVVVQLQHAGRGAQLAQDKFGRTVAPSAIDFPFLDYVPHELTHEEILETIKDFGQATKYVIESGFDGVEIHGANHYLLQQFFSEYSNRRTDEWGGSFENRMKFPLAVLDEVNRVAKTYGKDDFIIGYRISPEEIHGENIGYRIDESLGLIDRIADSGIDYLHLSLFTRYDAGPENAERSYAEIISEKVNGRMPVMTVSGVFNADDALDALNYGDIIAIGREALIEPAFAKKILENRTDEIQSAMDDNLEELAIPEAAIALFLMDGTPLPPLPGIDTLDESVLSQKRDAYSFDASSNN